VFAEHRDKALILGSDLVCGIKGMPGRGGIGKAHREDAKRLLRDPYLTVLMQWTSNDDADRYKDFYFHEEMRDVPIPKNQRYEPWAILESRNEGSGSSGICGLFRQPGAAPDLGPFAAGAFANGYFNQFVDISEAKNCHYPGFDLVAISGGMKRWGGVNGEILEHYRTLDVPVIICDPGRFGPNSQRLHVNRQGWMPNGKILSGDRLDMWGLYANYKPRGENILVAGQAPHLDKELAEALEKMRESSGRTIVFRPHPNMWTPMHQEECNIPYDRVSFAANAIGTESIRTLELDLEEAWVVVTHSSTVGINALMRGIPVVCHPDAPYHEASTSLISAADNVDSLDRPNWFNVMAFLRTYSYTLWSDREIAEGTALKFLKPYLEMGG
jgi:hypothetical protein